MMLRQELPAVVSVWEQSQHPHLPHLRTHSCHLQITAVRVYQLSLPLPCARGITLI